MTGLLLVSMALRCNTGLGSRPWAAIRPLGGAIAPTLRSPEHHPVIPHAVLAWAPTWALSFLGS